MLGAQASSPASFPKVDLNGNAGEDACAPSISLNSKLIVSFKKRFAVTAPQFANTTLPDDVIPFI